MEYVHLWMRLNDLPKATQLEVAVFLYLLALSLCVGSLCICCKVLQK